MIFIQLLLKVKYILLLSIIIQSCSYSPNLSVSGRKHYVTIGGQTRFSVINEVDSERSAEPIFEDESDPISDTYPTKVFLSELGMSYVINIPLIYGIQTQLNWYGGFGYFLSLPSIGIYWNKYNWLVGGASTLGAKFNQSDYQFNPKESYSNLYYDIKIGREIDLSILGIGFRKDRIWATNYMGSNKNKVFYDPYCFWGYEKQELNSPIFNLKLYFLNPGVEFSIAGSFL